MPDSRKYRAKVGYILLVGLFVLFGSMKTIRHIKKYHPITLTKTRTTSTLASHTKVTSPFLFDKNSADFKPATRIIRKNCNPVASRPLKTIPSFRNYKHYRNISELAVTEGDCDTPLAVCKVLHPYPGFDSLLSTHFPHMMQMVYMCYSFWQTNPSQIPVLYPYEKNKMIQLFERNQFLRGFIRLMKSELKLKILDYDEIEHWLIANTAKPSEKQIVKKGDGAERGVGGETGNCTHFKTIQMEKPRGYLLSHTEKLNELVEHHFSISGMTTKRESVDIASCSSPRIGILNRKPSNKRSIINSEQLVNEILFQIFGDSGNKNESTPETNSSSLVSLRYFEGETFEEQVRFFHSIDLLISPHGAQLTGIPFMANKRCTQLIELFPHNYLIPDFFGTLARDSGIEYSYTYLSNSSTEEMEKAEALSEIEGRIVSSSLHQRKIDRSQNFCVNPKLIVEATRHSLRKWCECITSV